MIDTHELVRFDEPSPLIMETPVQAQFEASGLAARINRHVGMVLADAEIAPETRFDTRIVTFDDNFEISAMHRARTEKAMISNGDNSMFLLLENDFGYSRFDDRLSLNTAAQIVRFELDGTFTRTAAAETQDPQLVETPSDLVVVSSDFPRTIGFGSPENELLLEGAPDVRRTYILRLSKADGVPKSYGLLSSMTAGECGFETLTQCTDEVLDFEEVSQYRDYRVSDQYSEAVWQKIAEQVDADCLEVCEADEACIVKADCVVDDVRLSASVEETIIGADATSYSAEFRLKRSVSVETVDLQIFWE